MRYYTDVAMELGFVRVVEEEGAILGLGVLRRAQAVPEQWLAARTPLLEEAARQLKEYFSGARRVFSLPLSPGGTSFQRAVWEQLARIPYGETRTYGEIAAALGSPSAARAVGGACHRNPIGIVIPCHRVIGAHGSLTGYAGGLDVKAYLLRLEGALPAGHPESRI